MELGTAIELTEIFERGVFPLDDQKRPITTHGFKDATADEATLESLFNTPNAKLVGLPTGDGLIVVDIDRKNGKDAFEWPDLYRLPQLTRKVRTPSGGEHWFYRLPAGVKIPCSAGQVFDGLDIRADGGYVAYGDRYDLLADEDVAPLNTAQIALLTTKRPRAKDLAAALDLSENSKHLDDLKSRAAWHDPMLRLTASYVAKGLAKSEIVSLLETYRWPEYSIEETRRQIGEMVDSAMSKGFALQPSKLYQQGRRPIMRPSEVYAAEPIKWLIENLIPETGVGLISGASGSFKSFLAGYLGLCVANGRKFADQAETIKGRVLYAAHEGRQGMGRRLVAATEHYGLPDSDLGLWDGITLTSDSDLQYLSINADRYDLCVIDTLSKATAGIDENSNSEMAAAIAVAYQLSESWQCFVLLIAHTGKDEARGTRGASALKANVDTVLSVKRSGDSRLLSVTIDKQKDGPDDLRFDFRMDDVDVIHPLTGQIEAELVAVPIGGNPSAIERIDILLRRDPNLTMKEIVSGVTSLTRSGCYQPVTDGAVKMALGRAVDQGTVIKNEGKYRVTGGLSI